MAELMMDVSQKTPDELGLDYALWNSKIIQEYVEKKYGIRYHRRSIRKIMTRLGFTAQKPMKMAQQRNPKKVKAWLETAYPKIKVKAMQEGARIYWGDEMGIQTTDNRARTYGLKGKTPIIKKNISRIKCNMLAIISPQGFMNWTVFKENFDSDKFITFLARIIRQIDQKIFLILDNHPVHKSRKVQDYVEKHKEKLELFFLPPYCPDLNPQELVNQDVKSNATTFRLIKNMHNLTYSLRLYLKRIQLNPSKIRNFFLKKEVRYAAY